MLFCIVIIIIVLVWFCSLFIIVVSVFYFYIGWESFVIWLGFDIFWIGVDIVGFVLFNIYVKLRLWDSSCIVVVIRWSCFIICVFDFIIRRFVCYWIFVVVCNYNSEFILRW